MFETYCNRTLPADVSAVNPADVWAAANDMASQIADELAQSEPLIAETVVGVAILMRSIGIIARQNSVDIDLTTAGMAREASASIDAVDANPDADAEPVPNRTPHHSLAYLVEQAGTANPYMRKMGRAIGLTREPYTPADLAAALRNCVAAQPTEPEPLTRLWVGYAVLLGQLGTSMWAATSAVAAAIDESRALYEEEDGGHVFDVAVASIERALGRGHG